MLCRLWKILFGRPDTPEEEWPRVTKCLLEIRYITWLLIVMFFVIQPFVIAGYDTPAGSMEPTIMTNTRYIALPSAFGGFIPFTRIKLPGYLRIDRGDIVIFRYPPDETQNYVKRVIGMPGDTVEIRDKTVLINGRPLSEPYVCYRDDFPINRNYGPVVVPEEHLFVPGDNRDNSSDSRYWGFVPIRNVFGTPLFTYWSYDREHHRIRLREFFKPVK